MTYVEFDEFLDVEASLVALNLALENVEKEPLLWKSILINSHAALAGACVCFLTKTDGSGALTEKSEKALQLYHNHQSNLATKSTQQVASATAVKRPSLELANLPQLLRRLPESSRVDIPKQCVDGMDERTLHLFWLHDDRSSLAHFRSHTWWIEEDRMLLACKSALILCQELCQSPGYKRLNRFPETRAIALLEECLSKITYLS